MPELWIKICGMRGEADIEAAVAAGADALGFVFHDPSPRNLTLDAARALQRAVPANIERVAVFLHPAQSLLDAVIDALQPDWLQTDLVDLETLELPAGQRVLPVLRKPAGSARPNGPNGFGTSLGHSRVMLDGGTSGVGMRADWTVARMLAARCELVLAGGLGPGNVADAVATVGPFGLDVSSGVERARGVKDPARIREFIDAARGAARVSAREAKK
jgi:phosphoribosylanthranilate isomerase